MHRLPPRAPARQPVLQPLSSRLSARLAPLASLTAIATLLLAACGGGGGGGSSNASGPATATAASADPLLVTGLTQACAGCGAATADSYMGPGIGIWARTNDTGAAINLQYAISGVAGKSIWLQLANLGDAAVTMPAAMASAVAAQAISPQSLRAASAEEDTQRAIGEYNRAGWADAARAPRAGADTGNAMLSTFGAPPAPLAASIGTTAMSEGAVRNWYHSDGSLRTATLRKQVTTGDGTRVNVWVENSEAGVTTQMVTELASTFAGSGMVYDQLVGVGGPVWGANSFPDAMLPAGMPVDIVVLNFNRDGKAYGTVGYFWGLHNFLRAKESNSNESISLYLDSETLALGGADGMRAVKTTMAHESTHMQNFYRRQVSMGAAYAYDTWLEEMTAMQMEDFLSGLIVSNYNPIRDVRLPDYYRYSDDNCNLTVFTGFGASCESYAVSGSFGGFLNRQLGMPFFRDLLARRVTSSKQAVDEAIKAVNADWSFDKALVNWRITTNSNMALARSPAGYGYPARTDGAFSLPAIDPSTLAFTTLRKLPPAASMLQGYGSVIAPRADTNGVYSDRVRVPAGVALSVVVY